MQGPQRLSTNNQGDGARRVAVLLFILFQALTLLMASGRLRVPDEQELYFQAESLVDRGDLAVPQAQQLGIFFGRIGRDGKAYAPYGPASAFLILPHHLAGRGAAALLGLGRDRPSWFLLVSAVTSFSSTTAAALCIALFYLLLRRMGGPHRSSLLWSLALGLGSYLFPYATYMFGEPFTAMLITASALLLLGEGSGRLISGALCFGLAVLCKAPLLIYTPGILLIALSERPKEAWTRRAGALLLAVGAAGLIHCWWNISRFGDPFQFGYDWGETIRGIPRPFGSPIWRGLFGLTLSPGKGLLFFAPPLILSLLALREPALRSAWTTWGALLCGLIGLLFYAPYVFWAGGYCVGPRHLLPLLPLLMAPGASRGMPQIPKPLLIFVMALAVGFQLLLVQVSFLEDQALGERPVSNHYYELLAEPSPTGLPRNRYRLNYFPQLSSLKLLRAGLADLSARPTPVGAGLDHWWIFFAKLRKLPVGGDIPAWPGWLLVVLAAGAAGLSSRALWKSSESKEQATDPEPEPA